MSVLAMAEITLSFERDISSVHRFYKIAASTTTPAAWTASQTADYIANGTIVSGWSLTEPAYDNTTTNSLYFFDLTVFSDNTYNKTDISKSSSYEAAKQAYVEAKAAQDAAAAIEQYFWHDSSGAHVTKIPKEQFVANPAGGNTLVDSNSIEFRDGTTSLAEFGATGARVGKTTGKNVSITSGGVSVNNSGTAMAVFSENGASFSTSTKQNAVEVGAFPIGSDSGTIIGGRIHLGSVEQMVRGYSDGSDYHLELEAGGTDVGNNNNSVIYLHTGNYSGVRGSRGDFVFSNDSVAFETDGVGFYMGSEGTTINSAVEISGDLILHKRILLSDKDGAQLPMIYINSSNIFGLGYGMYAEPEGETRIYGNVLKLYSNNTITLNRPLIVYGHSSAIGTVVDGTRESSAGQSTTSYTTVAHVDLTPGSWHIYAFNSFNGGTAGTRRVLITSNSSATTDAGVGSCTGYAPADTQIVVRSEMNVTISSNTTYYLRIRSGTAVASPYGNISAIRYA